MTSQTNHVLTPRVGMLATIRNRRALVSSVEPYDGRLDGRLHLVRLEYIDADGAPEDTVIWEREPQARLLEPVALPQIAGEPPMPPADFEAVQRATRWTAISPFLTDDDSTSALKTPIAAPLFGALQAENRIKSDPVSLNNIAATYIRRVNRIDQC